MEEQNKKIVKKDSTAKAKKAEKTEKKKEVKEVLARASFLRMSPIKIRLVIDQIRGRQIEAALDYLRFIPKGAVRPVVKLLNSAVANAENNFGLDKKDLYIKKFIANDGPFFKRYTPKAHGRATTVRKRTAHLEVILGVKEGAKAKAQADSIGEKTPVKVVAPKEIKRQAPKAFSGSDSDQGKNEKGFMKGVFQRKTG